MPANVTDLSVFLSEPKQVRLRADGPVYKVPGDLLVPVVVKLTALSQLAAEASGEDQADALVDLYGEVLELFREHQPDLERLPISADQLVGFVQHVYMDTEPDPTQPEAASTKTSPKPRPRKSASSS